MQIMKKNIDYLNLSYHMRYIIKNSILFNITNFFYKIDKKNKSRDSLAIFLIINYVYNFIEIVY